jgi:hypothetical protein
MSKTATRQKTHENGPAENPRPKAAYISAPAGVDTRPIRQALEARGVRTFSPDQLDLPGMRLPDILREAVQRADLVVAVVDPTAASNFVFYEVGYAEGMNKPAFVLLTENASPSLWVSGGVPYFRFDPANPSGLDFAVSQILKISHQGTKTASRPLKRTRSLGERADALLAQLKARGDDITPEDLESIIRSAIEESKVTTIAAGNGQDNGIDLAVWSDDLSPWVGNPIAIELRCELRSRIEVQADLAQMARVMERGDMPWGVLIYARSTTNLDNVPMVPNIILMSAQEFLESLRATSFGDLIRGIRNQRVHGGA